MATRPSDPPPVRSDWLTAHVVPQEGWLRRNLARLGHNAAEIDDLVQDAYLRLLEIPMVVHIDNPKAYFYQVVRSLVISRARRAKIVTFLPLDPQVMERGCDAPRPDQIAADRSELHTVLANIEQLPPHLSRVLKARRLDGLPQRATARKLDLSESTVEKNLREGQHRLARSCGRQTARSHGCRKGSGALSGRNR